MAKAGNRGAARALKLAEDPTELPLDRADRHHPDRHLRRRLLAAPPSPSRSPRRCAACPALAAHRRRARLRPRRRRHHLRLADHRRAGPEAPGAPQRRGHRRLRLRPDDACSPPSARRSSGSCASRPRRCSASCACGGEAPSAVTEEEVKAMIAEGTDAGVFHEAERELLEGVIRFADRPLRSIMVPRHAMVWIDVERPARGRRSPRCSPPATRASRSATARSTR